jgi:hypothetical protein
VAENQSQSEKFKQAARDLECDEDEARWDATLKMLAKVRPSPPAKDADKNAPSSSRD